MPVNRYQQKHLDHVRALFAVAVSEGLISANPFAGIKVRRTGGKHVDKKRGKSFTGRQVRHILAKAKKHLGPVERRADLVWVLMLCTYHGARVNEICQLRKEDIRTEQGITVIDIHDQHDDQSVKNVQSVRTVPLHKACKVFATYARKVKGPWIFSFTDYLEGGRGGWLIRNFPQFRREVCAIVDPKLKLHSLRHTWIDASRNVGMPEHIRRSIIGQTREAGVLGQYGQGAGVKTLAAWLNKVDPLA